MLPSGRDKQIYKKLIINSGEKLKQLHAIGVIILFLGLSIAPSITADVKKIDMANNTMIRTRYFKQGLLNHSYESKNSVKDMNKLEKIIFEMNTAFKEKDTRKIKSCITLLKDNHFIDESLYESCLNLLDESSNIYNKGKIEDIFCLVFAYSNNSINLYYTEVIIGLILGQIYLNMKEIGFSGILFNIVLNIFNTHILNHLVRLLIIKPMLPIAFLKIYDGFFHSFGANGYGYMNTDNGNIGGLMGAFSGVIIDIITQDEEFGYTSGFLFILGISGIVFVDEISL
jgi:hypothetical protein